MEATATEKNQPGNREKSENSSWPKAALDLIQPVAAEEGFGEDPKYTSEFEAAKLEIEKGASIDWESIQLNSEKLSREIAKDLRALGYLALAGFRTAGVSAGCSALLAACHYIKNHFEAVHPRREAAKLNSISWLNSDKLTAFLEGLSPQGDDKPIAYITLVELKDTKNFLTEKYPDNPPSIGQLIKVFESWVKNYKPGSAASQSAESTNPAGEELDTSETESNPSNGKVEPSPDSDPAQTSANTNGQTDTEKEVENLPDPEWVTALKSPISEENPTGEDPKYTSEFDVLKAEIEKMSGTDFELLVTEGIKVLTEQAKDIRVFGFLFLGSIKNEGIEHASYVLDCLAYWVETRFERLHPQRQTAKENAVKWLNQDRLFQTLSSIEPGEKYYSHVKRALEAYKKIKAQVFKYFPENPPSIGQLGKALEKWEKSAKPAPKETPKPASPETASAGKTPSEGGQTFSAGGGRLRAH